MKKKEQVHLVFFLDRPVRLVLESYNLCGVMYSYMPITYMNLKILGALFCSNTYFKYSKLHSLSIT